MRRCYYACMPKLTSGMKRSGMKRCSSRPGRPCDNLRAQRLQELLDTAAELFVANGYQGTSLDAVASCAGASKRTLYAHYSSKAELFQAVVRRETDKMHRYAQSQLPLNEPVSQALERFGLEQIHLLSQERSVRLLRALIATAEPFPELARSFADVFSHKCTLALESYLRQKAQQGQLVLARPRLAAHLLQSMIVGPYILTAQLGLQPSSAVRNQKTYVRECVRTFLQAHAYQADPPVKKLPA